MIENQEWIAEATKAITQVDPSAAPEISAIRGFELFGKKSPIKARLQDGSQWLVEEGNVRKLSDDEIAESLRAAQSFE